MERDGVYQEYKKCAIPRELELQWIEEKITNLVKMLTKCPNYKKIAEALAEYGHYAVLLKDGDMFDFMIRYVFERKCDWDTNTIFRNINAILSSASIIKDHKMK
ncbi:hypothetical protein [Holdemania massiliensis]|uniref:hypothetical protein n=1 Tax=Holdemania massiliensis TaxID=1468449 RepID=UPI001F05F611|nr:hypothetical protein [Holdemania massiliensis]MCH1939869.1 hypothetical protein [Holdemania massiliensis]